MSYITREMAENALKKSGKIVKEKDIDFDADNEKNYEG